jgi:hypothetical protein
MSNIKAKFTSGLGFSRAKERKVLSATDVTNGYVILSHLALPYSLTIGVQGAGLQEESIDAGASGDYVVSTDSSSGFTKVTWRGDLTTTLAAGDVIFAHYSY